jgi:hypothetical protein
VKEDDFAWRETQGITANVEQWKNRSTLVCMKFSLLNFPIYCMNSRRSILLFTTLRPQEPLVWDKILVDRLKELDNKWTRAIDFWFSRMKEGYIIEIVVEYTNSFSEAERKFVEGP